MHLPLTTLAAALVFAGAVPAQLAGIYTINPVLPASGSNFVSLSAATSALASQGVAGPVTMLVYDDAGPYTEATPFATSNVVYNPSTAVLVFTSWTGASSTNRITFRPAPGEAPVLDAVGQTMGVFWGGADYVTMYGFEIKNALVDGITLYAEASHGVPLDPIVDSCRIHDCGAGGVTIYGNTPNPTNTIVQNCSFWRLQLTNAGGFSPSAGFGYITTRRTTGTRIVHNTFFVDTGAGSNFCVFGANASSVTEVPYAEISNNVVFKTASAGKPIFRILTPTGSSFPLPVLCDSNCFFDATGGPFAIWGASGASTAVTLADWQLNAIRDLLSFEADPVFLDAAARNFHLQATSPCIGASLVAAGVTEDADGQPRVGALDLGSDEFSDATLTSVGVGCPGTAALVPLMTSHTWPFLGNPSLDLYVAQMPPGTLTFLFGSLGLGAPVPFGGGCTIYLDLGSFVGLAAAQAGPAGTASFVFPVPNNAAFVGFEIGYQSLVLDAGAPLGLTLTNALDIVFAF
ncbi:MAG TPA: right-handed parallel beta-helix repeat-containing protein [Planctomycetota bacterium]|nr:right-handed parallel beta-helix repeat-containing protein [Planctomycetota bacterium]